MTALPELEVGQKLPSNSSDYYRIIQRLGYGGNSHVYLVEAMTGQNRGLLFALKLFVRVSDHTRHGRFVREIAFLKECRHPAVMTIHDDGEILVAGQKGPTRFPFVIADYLPRTLFDAMRSGLTMLEKLSFVLQLLSATAFLSKLTPQVVHRDIKPENIFVRGKSCILGDFGLMKLLEAEASADGGEGIAEGRDMDIDYVVVSTGPRLPRFYRTPDLVAYCRNKGDLTPKSDVFQLGLVFAEMFTGENPLRACQKILDDIILDDLSPVSGSQSGAIRSNLKLMLTLDAEARPSAEDLLDPWEGVFLEAVKLSHQLEGRVF